ncbi:MAG: gliding motility lipoprotein GldD [Bacteroidales bacterium]|jgi:gliding motility-associated lipoprotein GldD|nr:gliding motility lipoprotein GldD [Bacteroidales bacterium]
MVHKNSRFLVFLSVCALLFASCEERAITTPKQRGYFRIDFPERNYERFSGNVPFSFNVPTYAIVEKDTVHGERYWLNVQFPAQKATIHLSYKNVKHDLEQFVDDAHFLVFKHDAKADAIKAQEFHYPEKNVHGLLFDIKGDAASIMQFYLTDSVEHFVRGALYFNVPPNKDSLKPSIQFVREDIMEMISSFEWK